MTSPEELYLELLKRVLIREISLDGAVPTTRHRPLRATNWKRWLIEPAQALLGRRGFAVTHTSLGPTRAQLRATGQDWPEDAESMIGRARMDNLHACVQAVLDDDVPGDLIETGVWRGGAVILMRAVLAANGDTTRTVWAADSFQGLPPATDPRDLPDDLSTHDELAVDLATVQANFAKFGLLDEQVRFVEGWFDDTLATIEAEQFALIRLDGDYYESTRVALDALWPKLAPGGFVIVDDYGIIDGCRIAVDEYRAEHGIDEPIEWIDQAGIFWRRSGG